MNKVRTENSYLADKAILRLSHLPEKVDPIMVLDAFGGFGKVWGIVQANTSRKIIRLGIDNKNISIGEEGGLRGDNRKFLLAMDLSKFHIIDLDAYGAPNEQLEIILNKRSILAGKRIFVTWIGMGWGRMPKKMLRHCGYTEKMIKKVYLLLTRGKYENIMLSYLNSRGIDEVWLKSIPGQNKYYFGFEL